MRGLTQKERVNPKLYRDYEDPTKKASRKGAGAAAGAAAGSAGAAASVDDAAGASQAFAGTPGNAADAAAARKGKGDRKGDEPSMYYRVTVQVWPNAARPGLRAAAAAAEG